MDVGELVFLGKEGRRILYKNDVYTVVITLSAAGEMLNIKVFPIDKEKYQIGVITKKKSMCKLLKSPNASMEEMERIVNSKDVFNATVDQVYNHPEIMRYLLN